MVIRGALVVMVVTATTGVWAFSPSQQASSAATPAVASPAQASTWSAQSERATIDGYCVMCHNQKLKTAGLLLDAADVSKIGENAAIWEKVVRKVQSGAMPPAAGRALDPATRGSMVAWLETELDKAGSAHPNPGPSPIVHRLSRTEYGNAVRDLFALGPLPKEMDLSLVLPADAAPSGFDNVPGQLTISPTLLEAYLQAAQNITRVAIGDPHTPLTIDTYRFVQELPQDVHIDGLPLGTRGGTLIRIQVPVDAEYGLKIAFAGGGGGGRGGRGGAAGTEQVDVSVDGARIKLSPVPQGNKPLELRMPMKAGSREIAVAFIQHPSVESEAMTMPHERGRGEQLAMESVTLSGPYNATTPSETPSRSRIFVCHPATVAEELPCASRILSTVTRRAYRRPSTNADIAQLLPFFTEGKKEGGFDAGIERALQRVLVSPRFLFRIEQVPAGVSADASFRVSNLELASRLSFFIWSSIPDDELLDIAVKGKLKDPAVLEQQTRRMLADSRAESLVSNFGEQWLYLRDLKDKTPDRLIFPDFDEGLRRAMSEELRLFLNSIFLDDRNVIDLLRANYTFVNERLAKHYGIPNVYGSQFRRITLDDNSARRGLLGKGAILTLTAYATRTSPVLRGKWVLENILGSPPPPPPPNVPALEEKGNNGKTMTMREAMTQHRANPVCAGCHARMDPVGFSMENFDAVGQWRTSESEDGPSGPPIDASGGLNGSKFEGVSGLLNVLLDPSGQKQFVGSLTEKLLSYAISRDVQYFDEPVVREITRQAAANDYRFSSLVLGIVKSTPFQWKKVAPPEAPPTPTLSASRQ